MYDNTTDTLNLQATNVVITGNITFNIPSGAFTAEQLKTAYNTHVHGGTPTTSIPL
jgi:hypothetical protein